MNRLPVFHHLIQMGFALLLSWHALPSMAQENPFTISGYVLDAATSEPLPFASIYLKSASIGTTTNEEGLFVFHLPVDRQADTVVISVIGYASVFKKANAFAKNQKILLAEVVTNLGEAVVTASREKGLTAKEIVRKAYREISDNYPDQPYVLEGYVRDLIQEDDQHVEYLECATKLRYPGHQTPSEPMVELMEVRTRFLGNKHPWNEDRERKNSIIDLVEDDLIVFDYGPIKGKNGWKYELESILPYNEGMVYKIRGVDKPFQTATLFIDAETFAFVRIELTRAAQEGDSWVRRLSNGALQVYYNMVIEYQEYRGKMYLKYQKEEDRCQIFEGAESDQLLFRQNPKKELFINRIVNEDLDRYPFQKNLDIELSIENQAKAFNADFWRSYNIPAQTAEESTIIQELQDRTE